MLRSVCLGLIVVFALTPNFSHGQNKVYLGLQYGHSWFTYNYKDYGSGFINKSRANNKFTIGAKLKYVRPNEKFFYETGIGYCEFQQYYSLRNYLSAWEERYPVITVPFRAGLNLYKPNSKMQFSIAGGVSLNFLPEQYQGEYSVVFLKSSSPRIIDSITRGNIIRDFGGFFPLLNLSAAGSYKIGNKLKAEVSFEISKGFYKITEYEAFYNDGSGLNDQRANQWGKGDNYSLRFALLYDLSRKSEKK